MGLPDIPAALPLQQHLFGEPPQDADQDQLWTPMWCARRMAAWIPRGYSVLEPSAGRGNLVAALLEAGHAPEQITAVEKDPAWAEYVRQRFDGLVRVMTGNFFDVAFAPDSFAYVLSNWPYASNQHTRFAVRCLEIARTTVTLVPISFEYTQERDRDLWATKGVVTRRARLPERVDHGGPEDSGKFDSCVLKIQRRPEPRRVDEVVHVAEEVWRKQEGCPR